MIKFTTMHSHSRGFSLLEALIALVVLATGLLAVARFQSGLVTNSGSSKARAEAVALAQQKIDAIRSYKDEPELVANLLSITYDASKNFEDDVASDNAVPDTAETIVGSNTDFQRQWSITKGVGQKSAMVDVKVSWSDPNSGVDASGNAYIEEVLLSTEVAWANPALGAALGLEDADPLVPSSTGRARLGEGQYDPADLPSMDLEDNEDGTSTFKNLATGEVELIDNVTGDVLITLEDACNSTSGGLTVCTDFVRISGYIWIHKGSNIDPDIASDLFIDASDAAICAEITSAAVTVGSGSSEYVYFPYTCYLGGGYYGNIGLTQTGSPGDQGDVCVGDPLAATINTPVIANRRVYRGMLSRDQYTSTGTTPPADLIVDDIDNNSIAEYDSIGVADALRLPNPYDTTINNDYLNGYEDASGNLYLPGHNYMVTDLGANPDDADCIAPMTDPAVLLTLTDASSNSKTVNAFAGVEDDFVCLNQLYPFAATDASSNAITAQQPFYDVIDFRIDTNTIRIDVDSGHIDANDIQYRLQTAFTDASANFVYKVETTQAAVTDASGNTIPDKNNNIVNDEKHFMDSGGCPFDPADPPSELDFLYGSLYFTDATALPVSGFVINTSDDIAEGTVGNCTVSLRAAVSSATRGDGTIDGAPGTGVFADYACKIYHTYDATGPTGTGWDGNVTITPANNFGCSNATNAAISTYTFPVGSPILADTGNQTGTAGTLDFNCEYTGLQGSDMVTTVALSSADDTPLEGSTVSFLVTATNNGPAINTNVTLSVPTPAGLTLTSAVPSSGTSFSTGTWTLGTVGLGASATLTMNYSVNSGLVTASPGTNGLPTMPITFEVPAPAAGDQTDASTIGDILSVEVIPTSINTANLVTVKTLTSGNTTPAIGDIVTFAVTVTNLGGGNVTNVRVEDDYPETLLSGPDAQAIFGYLPIDWGVDSNGSNNTATNNSDGSPSNWPKWTWAIATLNAGDSTTMTVSGVVTAAGTITNTVTEAVSATLSDPSDINNVLSSTVVASAVAAANEHDLVTTITVDNATPIVGDVLTYTITMTNNGPQNTGTATTTVDLDTTNDVTGLTLLTLSPNAPSATSGSFDNATGVWSGISLTSGATATLTLKAAVTSAAVAASPVTVNTTVATASKTDPTTVGDSLSVSMNATGAPVLYTPAVISGSVSKSPGSASKLTAMTVQALDLGNAPTGSIIACTVPAAGTSYSCSIDLDSSLHSGVILQQTNGASIACHDAKIVSGVVVAEGTPSAAAYVWISGLAANITRNVAIGGTDADCP